MKTILALIFVTTVALTSAFHLSQKEARFDPSKGPEQLVDLRKVNK